MEKPLIAWLGFFSLITLLLIFDLGLLNRKHKDITIKRSLWLSLFYVTISIIFGLVVTFFIGAKDGDDFFTGYLVEKSLSLDNIFAISLVFTHFQIPQKYQHRVLFWGILGAVLMRGVMIYVGATIIEQFHFVLYIFGAFLIFTGLRMLFLADDEEKSMEENKLLAWLQKKIPLTDQLAGNNFFVRENNILKATPLFLVLIFIELADVVFAVDSVPAVFSVTTDKFVVYTSNIFAILGLRALYFALCAMLHRFAYLKYAISLILVFIGSKIFLAKIIEISSAISLLVTVGLLAAGVLLSLYKTRTSNNN
ncbi:MAG: TerC family protein [Pseudomonadota bacterium]